MLRVSSNSSISTVKGGPGRDSSRGLALVSLELIELSAHIDVGSYSKGRFRLLRYVKSRLRHSVPSRATRSDAIQMARLQDRSASFWICSLAIVQLVDAGMSQRQAAKALGVSHTQIQNDLAENLPENGKKVATKAERRGERAAELESSKGFLYQNTSVGRTTDVLCSRPSAESSQIDGAPPYGLL